MHTRCKDPRAMGRWRSLSLTLLLGLSACADDAVDLRAAAEAAAESVSSAWLQQRLSALAADAMEGRDNLTAGGKRARDYLAGEMAALGLQPAGRAGYEQSFDKGVNLLGLLPGTDPDLAGELVLVGGHYDHLGRADVQGSQCSKSSASPGDVTCNGAWDNATGCALTLAVVKALKEAGGVRRPLLVAFWDAEEDGLLGSRHFVEKDPTRPLSSLAAVMNVDAVGGEMIPGVGSSFALGAEYATGLRELVHANSKALKFTTYPVSSFFVGSDRGGRSDHLYFRERGIPSLFFCSGAGPTYHTPADELSVVKPEKLLLTARHVLLMVADVANAAARPGFVASPSPQLDDARALYDLGHAILANPAAVGLTDQGEVALIKFLLGQLQRYLDSPPRTKDEWETYEGFVKTIIKLVFELY